MVRQARAFIRFKRSLNAALQRHLHTLELRARLWSDEVYEKIFPFVLGGTLPVTRSPVVCCLE